MSSQECGFKRQDLSGKVAIVTGANKGIGFETAKQLAEMKAKVFLACRSSERATAAIEDIKQTIDNADVHFLDLDLAKLTSVRSMAEKFIANNKCLDILIHNAGVINTTEKSTEDGYEETMQVNYLAPILLTTLLLPSLKNSTAARVVNVSSTAHRYGTVDLDNITGLKGTGGYGAIEAYGNSKLFLNMATEELAVRLRRHNVQINSTHPGFVATDMWKNEGGNSSWTMYLINLSTRFMAKEPAQAAKTTLHAAVDPSVRGSGDYYEGCCKMESVIPSGTNDSSELVDKSFSLLGLDLSVM